MRVLLVGLLLVTQTWLVASDLVLFPESSYHLDRVKAPGVGRSQIDPDDKYGHNLRSSNPKALTRPGDRNFRERALVIFYHIPKNGGTSVYSLLDKQFPTKDICKYYFYHEIHHGMLQTIRHYRFVRGHVFYAQLKNLPAKRITFLREPVARVLSEHRFWLKYVQQGIPDQLYKEHFLPAGDPLDTVTNHQCLFLSSFDPRCPFIPMKQHLKSACYNLKRNFFFVGILEKFEESIAGLYVKMGWQKPTEIPKLNTTTDIVETYPPQVLKQIAARNWADIKLYMFAKKLFKKQCPQKHVVASSRGRRGHP